MITSEAISRILFRHDPANTSCVENEATDEYDRVAESIAELINDELYSADYSVRVVLNESFGSLEDMNENMLHLTIGDIDDLIRG